MEPGVGNSSASGVGLGADHKPRKVVADEETSPQPDWPIGVGAWPASVLQHYSGAARSQISVPLGLLQRILLTTDGTVTHILEAFTGEPMEVVKLFQTVGPWDRSDSALDLTAEDIVIRRAIVLRGQWSKRNILYGDSIIAHERVGPEVRAGLLSTDRPIGKLLFENHVETFREILAWGEEPAGTCADHIGIQPTAPVLFRTYRIMSGNRPIMLITERFPARFVVDIRTAAWPGSVSAAVVPADP